MPAADPGAVLVVARPPLTRGRREARLREPAERAEHLLLGDEEDVVGRVEHVTVGKVDPRPAHDLARGVEAAVAPVAAVVAELDEPAGRGEEPGQGGAPGRRTDPAEQLGARGSGVGDGVGQRPRWRVEHPRDGHEHDRRVLVPARVHEVAVLGPVTVAGEKLVEPAQERPGVGAAGPQRVHRRRRQETGHAARDLRELAQPLARLRGEVLLGARQEARDQRVEGTAGRACGRWCPPRDSSGQRGDEHRRVHRDRRRRDVERLAHVAPRRLVGREDGRSVAGGRGAARIAS